MPINETLLLNKIGLFSLKKDYTLNIPNKSTLLELLMMVFSLLVK